MKTVLVTGGSRGIGAAVVRAFAKAGCQVALNYAHSEKEARALAQELAPWVRIYRADVSRADEVRAMLEAIRRDMGPVDTLVNNAGIAWEGLFQDMTEAEWDKLFNVNVKGVFLVSREVLPDMLSAMDGRIINIASMWGQVGASCEVAYSAAKAAVIGMTRALAKETAPMGVRVNCVAPGAVDTDMMAIYPPEAIRDLCEETPLGRMAEPCEIAEAVLYLANAKFVTGEVLAVNGGLVMGG